MLNAVFLSRVGERDILAQNFNQIPRSLGASSSWLPTEMWLDVVVTHLRDSNNNNNNMHPLYLASAFFCLALSEREVGIKKEKVLHRG